MMRNLLFFGVLFRFSVVVAQPAPTAYEQLISSDELKSNLTILASDALEGRATGSRGQKMAAAFISYHFQELGLQGPVDGNFYQPFDLYKIIPGETYLNAGGTQFQNFKDVVYFGKDGTNGEMSLPVVFAGRGQAEDFQDLDVAGKGVMLLIGEGENYRSPVALARSRNAKMVFILNTTTRDQFVEYARNFESFIADGRLSLRKPATDNSNSGMFFISPEVGEKIFNTTLDKLSSAASASKNSSRKKIGTGKVAYKTSVEVETVPTENVLGFLEGTDKKDEVIVITSHYDHIGMKSEGEGDLINNGADDDGSGTVAVMQIAKAFAQAKKDGKGPRRSILFMTVAGEENGLLGSEYYTQYPVFPLANTVVNLNIDMIGRRDEQHADSPPYVYVIGADKLSSALHEVSESVNKRHTKLVFDYTYNDENHPARLYYRSDHWNFAQKNIPIIFYFDGIHEDYHQPSDEVDKIEFDLLTKRTKCIFYTAWEIANRDERIQPDINK
ncbi:MAG TPA: M28 family peptidase [Chryseosolibacter sp.]